MADYRQVYMHLWGDDWFCELSERGKLLWLYLITGPETSVAGIYRLTMRRIVYDTGLDAGDINNLLCEFERDGKIMRSGDVIWIRKMRDYQASDSPTVLKRITRDLRLLPDSETKQAYLAHYHGFTDDVPGRGDRVSIPYRYGMDTLSLNRTEQNRTDTTETNVSGVSPGGEAADPFQEALGWTLGPGLDAHTARCWLAGKEPYPPELPNAAAVAAWYFARATGELKPQYARLGRIAKQYYSGDWLALIDAIETVSWEEIERPIDYLTGIARKKASPKERARGKASGYDPDRASRYWREELQRRECGNALVAIGAET